MLYQVKEWQSPSGYWKCNCVDDLGKNSALWYHPARILKLSPADFIRLLLKDFKPDCFYFNEKNCLCFWSWKSQESMRKYKNWINKKAREANYQI